MTYRPYPNRARALSQVDRGRVAASVREPSEFERQVAAAAFTFLENLGRALRPVAEAVSRTTINVQPAPSHTETARPVVGIHSSVIRAAEWRARNA
ncbi:hypothetical protein ACIQ6R_06310 [Streptomyces sp. NPDC096048]|uniref:hypothetical protein n=1 Tax=Streptomyces sp. NPDC096048 TaxID=3366072 RepID=UPI0037F98EA9